jgi:16S rRNA processing protein RimM
MYVELGKIVGVWGVKGWIKLHSYTRNRADIANYKKWFLQSSKAKTKSAYNELTEIEVLNCREQGRGIVAQLEGVNDRDQAAGLSGWHILVKQSDLPKLPKGEYYWHQLIGLMVSSTEGKQLGQIDSLLETGANDVLVIKPVSGGSDVLIPNTKEVVKEIDIKLGTMLVDWDPSYLED